VSNPGVPNDNLANKTGLRGVCVNDVDKSIRNEFLYRCWEKMVYRVFDIDCPEYAKRTMCDEWRCLSSFIDWGEEQDYEGKQLDKDLLVFGNRYYSPDTCCFISSELNHAIRLGIERHGLMVGVRQGESQKRNNKYCGQIGHKSEYIHLGTFSSELAAHNAYRMKKAEILRDYSDIETNPMVKAGLIGHAEVYEDLACII